MSEPSGPSALFLRTPVEDATQVRIARNLAVQLATAAGLDARRTDVVALTATELAENLHRHAVGGELLVRCTTEQPGHGQAELTLIAVDRGPGVENFSRCLRDGYTTVGTMGTGLGAVSRLTDRFDAVSEPGRGTVVLGGFALDTRSPQRADAGFDVGAIGFPIETETENGDSWSVQRRGNAVTVMLADGLGHGPDAAAASGAAVAEFGAVRSGGPLELLAHVNRQISGTRGAAVSVARLDLEAARDGGAVVSAGMGNVSIVVVAPDGRTRRLATSHGTAGARGRPAPTEQRHAFPARGVLVLHTDGLSSRWTLDGRGRLLSHHADTIAAALWRDHSRGTDDSFVVVAKAAEQ